MFSTFSSLDPTKFVHFLSRLVGTTVARLSFVNLSGRYGCLIGSDRDERTET